MDALTWVMIGAIIAAVGGAFVSAYLISQHLHNFNIPNLQSKIVGILWMIPIYSFNSALSLLFPKAAEYLDPARDCYEAYVLYLFFALMLAFLARDDETVMFDYLEKVSPPVYSFPFNYCTPQSIKSGQEYLRFLKFGVMQYCLVRPVLTGLAILLSLVGLYDNSDYNPLKNVHPHFLLILNISVALAFSSLLTFYYLFHNQLSAFNPIPKFLCIKIMIFMIFWQGVLIGTGCHFKVIVPPPGSDMSSIQFGAYLQNILICYEMLFSAFGHWGAFSYKPFSFDNTGHCPMAHIYHYSPVLQAPLLDDEDDSEKGRHKARSSSSGNSSMNKEAKKVLKSKKKMSADKEGWEKQAPQKQQQARSLSTMKSKVGHQLPGMNIDASAVNSQNKDMSSKSTIPDMVTQVLNANFAHNTAVRDFNEAMPFVLPSGFTPSNKGKVIHSNPEDRLKNNGL